MYSISSLRWIMPFYALNSPARSPIHKSYGCAIKSWRAAKTFTKTNILLSIFRETISLSHCAPDKPTLHRWRSAILDFLPSLRLKLHEKRAAVYPTATGIPFLGWRVFADHHQRLKRRNGIAFQRRFKLLRARFARGEIDLKKMDQSVRGWIAHVQHGQTFGLRSALLNISLTNSS